MIDLLLEKYWKGETSNAEETQLRNFFQNENIDEQYEALRPLFSGTETSASVQPSEEAESRWLETLSNLDKDLSIDQLLEKYWEGESDLNEEEQLRKYFQSADLDAKYKHLQPMFVGLEKGAEAKPTIEAESRWKKTLSTINGKSEAKVIGMPKRNWWKVAAVALLLIGVGGSWVKMIEGQEKRLAMEKQEAMEIYEQTREALAMMGIHMKKGTDKTAKEMNKVSKNLGIIHNN